MFLLMCLFLQEWCNSIWIEPQRAEPRVCKKNERTGAVGWIAAWGLTFNLLCEESRILRFVNAYVESQTERANHLIFITKSSDTRAPQASNEQRASP